MPAKTKPLTQDEKLTIIRFFVEPKAKAFRKPHSRVYIKAYGATGYRLETDKLYLLNRTKKNEFSLVGHFGSGSKLDKACINYAKTISRKLKINL